MTTPSVSHMRKLLVEARRSPRSYDTEMGPLPEAGPSQAAAELQNICISFLPQLLTIIEAARRVQEEACSAGPFDHHEELEAAFTALDEALEAVRP